ncbi:MAG: PaaI family thioesterase [Eggerthellaceae bacterium]|jgi:acyl-CoA thioesterase
MEQSTIEEVRVRFARDEFATKCLGAVIDRYDCETGEAQVSMTIDNRHHNGQGFIMGGVFFSLSDFALAVAGNMNQPPTSSVSSSIQYLRRAKGKRLIAKARPDKLGRNLAFITVDVYDELGTHCTRMVATMARTDH